MSLNKGTYDYDFQQFIEEVYQFNDIAEEARDKGETTLEDLKNQYKVVLEEVEELGDELEINNPVKVLDGVVDTLVTVLGMARQLEDLGFDVLGACQQVAFDNLMKYPLTESVAIDTQKFYLDKGINTTYQESITELGKRYVILDVNNKVRKPYNFIGTDLTDYVPENFKVFA